MNGWLTKRWLAWALGGAVLLALLSGCSGVLFESNEAGGQVERLRLDTGAGWDRYDNHPRYPYSRRNSQDEMRVMLLREMTF